MSVDVASLPAWKLALLERKRRQEVDSDGGVSKSDGSEALGKIPPWKQEILFRKQQKRHSTGRTFEVVDGENRRSLSEILLSPEDGERCSRGVESWQGLLSPVMDGTYYSGLKSAYHLSNTAVDRAVESGLDDVPVEEERLPPIHQNPILLLDLEKRQHSGFMVGLSSPGASVSQQRSGLRSWLSKSHVDGREIIDGDSSEHIQCQTNEAKDDVFREDEVMYGKGFVSRLLQKFSYLSGRDDQSIVLPPPFFRSLNRGQSSEDFTRSRYEPDVELKKSTSRKKANSLDDLLKESMIDRSVMENGSATNGREGMREPPLNCGGQEEVSIVLSAKSIFEGLATSPTSIKNSPFQERLYTSAKTQEAVRSAENHREPYRKEAKDNAGALFGPAVHQSDTSATAHHPPAIIGPKPVYTGRITSSQKEHKKCLNAQLSDDFKSTEDTADETTTSAQISLTTAPQIRKPSPEPSNTGSLSDSNVTTGPPLDSNEHCDLSSISPHIEEPSTITGHIPVDPISIPSQSHSENSASWNAKTHELPRKETTTVPKKSPPLRPGLLLIRPASNLSSMRTEYLQMTKYNDITRGEFAPAKRVVHKIGGSDEEEESDGDEVDGVGNCSKDLRIRYEFEGGGVLVGRSLLAKTKQGIQLKISFDDSITSTYEYPSEQCLIDSMPPEPGDADYPTGLEQNEKALPGSRIDSGQSASNASSITSTVSLSSYKSKTQVDFAFDTTHTRKTNQETLAPSSDLQSNQEVVVTQSEVAVSWSGSTSSDHVLF